MIKTTKIKDPLVLPMRVEKSKSIIEEKELSKKQVLAIQLELDNEQLQEWREKRSLMNS